ncbi:MAG: 4-hydroxy-tetrahydrodipicolinate synthase [Clostridia bacterium]|nr:4-hydroxy-tetrahydrodipicolinate synthase [Clostridia bacterium]
MKLQGCLTALVTPFDETGKIDFESLRRLIRFQLENNVDGLVVLGTTAETPTLKDWEKEEIIRIAVNETKSNIPIIAGVSSNDTAVCENTAQKWEKMGADALLVLSPYYNKANENGMRLHFEKIADSVKIPIILYNVPSRTGCKITPDVAKSLLQHSNIIGIKDAGGDIAYTMDIAQYVSDSFTLLSGNDDMVIPTLSVGGKGVISVISNLIPQEWSKMVRLYPEGKSEEALKIQMKYLDLIKALFCEPNPIPIKTAMGMPRFRLPLCPMMPENAEKLRKCMKAVGLC